MTLDLSSLHKAVDSLERALNVAAKEIEGGVEVRAFGSRVSGMAKPYSDLDLVIMGEHKMDAKTLMNLNEDFADSDIPFRVEILDWHDITNEFRRIIKPRSERI
jgi:predicted nucleotidyltransferase